MSVQTIVVIGGGHAGLHAVKQIEQKIVTKSPGKFKLVLIDKESSHLRKVLLFRAAVGDQPLRIPFSYYFDMHVELIQASISGIDPSGKVVRVIYPDGSEGEVSYDRVVLAIGNAVTEAASEKGGISLTNIERAKKVKAEILEKIALAKNQSEPDRRRQLLTIAIAGAGITGVETSAEISQWMREKVKQAGLDPNLVEVKLFNGGIRLLPEAPVHVSRKLEQHLQLCGVTVFHQSRVESFANGTLVIQNQPPQQAAVCIWTLGIKANPLVQQLGLPIEPDGKLGVDRWYHVKGLSNVYAIGDCAKIIDSETGKEDGMTCKEGIAQAQRLCEVIKSELEGKQGPRHKGYPISLYCIGLGPGRGFIWMQKWGLNIVLTGKLGAKIKDFTWNFASLMNKEIVRKLEVGR